MAPYTYAELMPAILVDQAERTYKRLRDAALYTPDDGRSKVVRAFRAMVRFHRRYDLAQHGRRLTDALLATRYRHAPVQGAGRRRTP